MNDEREANKGGSAAKLPPSRRKKKTVAKPAPPKINIFRFTPQEDITAYELAIILAVIYSKIQNVNLTDKLAENDPTWLSVERHFTKEGEAVLDS